MDLMLNLHSPSSPFIATKKPKQTSIMSSDGDEGGNVPYAEYVRTLLQQGVLQGKLPRVTTNPNDLEAQARKAMSKKGFEYIYGGVGEGAGVVSNRAAFARWNIVPRVLVPTSPRDLSVTLFGQRYDSPVVMAPIGVQSWYHADAEIGTATACANLRVPYTLSTASSTGIEALAEAVPDSPKWFQLYWPLDEDITASMLRRAKASGFRVLVVTLDAWTLGWRPQDLDAAAVPFIVGEGDAIGFSDPVFRKKFADMTDGGTPEDDTMQAAMYWCSEVFPGTSRSWEDLAVLKRHWDGPIVLKGVLSVEDAKLAKQHGMDGIVVSSHGGRQLDGAIGTLDILPEIVAAVGDQLTVMLDSGIRTGADMVKALALGARAVLVGRPVVYGLGIDGKNGAEAVLAGLLADLDLTMGFSGAKTVADLTPSILRRVDGQEPVKSRL